MVTIFSPSEVIVRCKVLKVSWEGNIRGMKVHFIFQSSYLIPFLHVSFLKHNTVPALQSKREIDYQKV